MADKNTISFVRVFPHARDSDMNQLTVSGNINNDMVQMCYFKSFGGPVGADVPEDILSFSQGVSRSFIFPRQTDGRCLYGPAVSMSSSRKAGMNKSGPGGSRALTVNIDGW